MQDFATLRHGAESVRDGVSPYPAADGPTLARAERLVYPPVIAYLFIPFAYLPYEIAAAVYLALCVVAVPGAVWLLGVRDRRCLLVAFAWPPTMAALSLGALGTLLTLGVAAAWRFRAQAVFAAAIVAAVVTSKIFLWPLIGWLVAARRWAAAGLAAVLAAVGTLAAFAAVGPKALAEYPALLRALARVFEDGSFSSSALAMALGLPDSYARAVPVVAVVGVFTLMAVGAKRRVDERRLLVLAVVAALVGSPIVWLHYLVLLIVPIGLLRRRFGPLWLAPLAFWVSREPESFGELWRLVFVLAVATAIVALALASPASGRSRTARLPALRPRVPSEVPGRTGSA